MSWGERSCRLYASGCPVVEQNMSNCNVDCEHYQQDPTIPQDSLPGLSVVIPESKRQSTAERRKRRKKRRK